MAKLALQKLVEDTTKKRIHTRVLDGGSTNWLLAISQVNKQWTLKTYNNGGLVESKEGNKG